MKTKDKPPFNTKCPLGQTDINQVTKDEFNDRIAVWFSPLLNSNSAKNFPGHTLEQIKRIVKAPYFRGSKMV